MKISQEAITGAHQIRDYGDGFLLIQSVDGQTQRLTGSFILGSAQLQSPAPNYLIEAVSEAAFSQLKNFSYDILIVVTDEHINANTVLIMRRFRNAGFTAEFMAVGPACRTFNLLLAEGRKPLMLASL